MELLTFCCRAEHTRETFFTCTMYNKTLINKISNSVLTSTKHIPWQVSICDLWIVTIVLFLWNLIKTQISIAFHQDQSQLINLVGFCHLLWTCTQLVVRSSFTCFDIVCLTSPADSNGGCMNDQYEGNACNLSVNMVIDGTLCWNTLYCLILINMTLLWTHTKLWW